MREVRSYPDHGLIASCARSTIVAFLLAAISGMPVTAQESPVPMVWEFNEIIRVGDNEESVGFGSVSGLAFGPQGQLLVLDRLNGEVVVLDPSGETVRTIGRKGNGPGEFSVPVTLATSKTGRVFVVDIGSRRISQFAVDGEFLNDWPLQLLERGVPVKIGLLEDGLIIQRDPFPVRMPGTDGAPRSSALTLSSLDGTQERVFRGFPALGQSEVENGRISLPSVFTPRLVWGVTTSGRVVAGSTQEYSLALLSRDGAEVAHIRRRVVHRRVPSELEQSIRRGELPRSVTGAGALGLGPTRPDSALIRRFMRNVRIEEHLPLVAGVMPGPAGTVLVIRDLGVGDSLAPAVMGVLGPDPVGVRMDVFDELGRYLGTVEIPEGFRPMAVWEDRMAGLQADSLDRSVVRVLRIDTNRTVSSGAASTH